MNGQDLKFLVDGQTRCCEQNSVIRFGKFMSLATYDHFMPRPKMARQNIYYATCSIKWPKIPWLLLLSVNVLHDSSSLSCGWLIFLEYE